MCASTATRRMQTRPCRPVNLEEVRRQAGMVEEGDVAQACYSPATARRQTKATSRDIASNKRPRLLRCFAVISHVGEGGDRVRALSDRC